MGLSSAGSMGQFSLILCGSTLETVAPGRFAAEAVASARVGRLMSVLWGGSGPVQAVAMIQPPSWVRPRLRSRFRLTAAQRCDQAIRFLVIPR